MTDTLSENLGREQETKLESPRVSNTGAKSIQNPTCPNREQEFWDDIPLSPEEAEILKKSRFTTAAIDYLEGTVYGAWPDLNHHQNKQKATGTAPTHIFERLEALKIKAQENNSPAALSLKSISDPIGVLPNGRGGGIPVQVVLEFQGCSIGICTTDRGDGVAARYIVPGDACLMFGAQQCYDKCLAVLGELGLVYDYDVCSRVDLCADIKGLEVITFVHKWQQGAFICRSSAWSAHGPKHNQCGTLSVGSGGGIYMRIYDKRSEIVAKNGEEADSVLDVMAEHRWGGEIPDKAIRVEFQIRRDSLSHLSKRWGVDFRSGADVIRLAGALSFYCCGSVNETVGGGWIRFTEDTVDRENKHQSRAKVCKEWKLVQQTFASCFESQEMKPEPKPLKTPDCRKLMAQVRGLLSTVAALKRLSPNADLLAEFGSLLGADLPKIREAIKRKRFDLSLTAFGHS